MNGEGAMLEGRLREIEVRLGQIETIMKRMDHALFGNGQPGELNRVNARIAALEEFKWRAVGALGLAVILYEVVMKLLLKG